MGDAGAEAAAAAGGAAEDGPGAAAEASGVTTATDRSTIIPKPANWGRMTSTLKRNWWKKAKGKVR